MEALVAAAFLLVGIAVVMIVFGRRLKDLSDSEDKPIYLEPVLMSEDPDHPFRQKKPETGD